MAAHFKHRTHAARGRIYPHERHAGISRDVPVCHSARRDTGGHNPVLEQNVAVSEQKEKRQRYKKRDVCSLVQGRHCLHSGLCRVSAA